MLRNSLLCALWLFLLAVRAQIPCDDAYGAHCPEATGWGVGDCLKQQSVGDACAGFIKVHDACKGDIDSLCVGMEYTGEALPCLTERVKPSDLSASCLEALPKKENKERKQSAEEKAKADKRRRTRNKAAKIAREF